MNVYSSLATAVLVIHSAFIAWVIFGWLAARNHASLRWIHFGSILYGIVIEIVPWPCPLTLLEQWLESQAGVTPYRQPFLIHYLEAIVYPNVPDWLLISCAALVCGFNLFLHARRMMRRV